MCSGANKRVKDESNSTYKEKHEPHESVEDDSKAEVSSEESSEQQRILQAESQEVENGWYDYIAVMKVIGVASSLFFFAWAAFSIGTMIKSCNLDKVMKEMIAGIVVFACSWFMKSIPVIGSAYYR